MSHTDDLLRTRDVFDEHGVEYMFIGKGAAVIQGFSDANQNVEVCPLNDPENNRRLASALRALGFELSDDLKAEVTHGKDFIQLRGPFDLDLVFAPDGFESYNDAKKYKLVHEGCPVMSIEGILHTKKASGRIKDRESLVRLQSFKEYLDAKE